MGRIARHTALAAGIVTAGVFAWVRPLQHGVATAPVVVAQTDMREGTSIDRAALAVAQWPVGTIPAGAFTSIDAVAGRVTRVSMFKGEAIVPGRLAPDGKGPGVEVKITPGKRALSFRFNDVSGIAGLIQPNARVDIVLVADAGGKKGKVARVFMENMRILAIGAVPNRSTDGRLMLVGVATVEVTPDEGERLAVATAHGQVHLMLRGYGENTAPDVQVSNTPLIFTTMRRAPPATPTADTNTVTIIRGSDPTRRTMQAPRSP